MKHGRIYQGEKMEKPWKTDANGKWTSNAEWPDTAPIFNGTRVTTDIHADEQVALGVCRLLNKEGWGGERKIFPKRTWVEPVKE